MPRERLLVFSGTSVPQPDDTTPTPASDGVSIGTKRNAFDTKSMSVECPQVFSGISVPQPDSTGPNSHLRVCVHLD